MHSSRNLKAVAAIAAVGALTLAACSGTSASDDPSSEGSAATGDPIVVAALSGLTFFPEAPEAVQAVFDDYNAAGGLDGRPIDYTVYDDKTDPAASATAAQDALSSGAVALVGGSSLLDCAVNHTTWEENGIVSIQGTGVDPYCFATPNIAPTNTGPYFDTFATLYYGSEELGFENICAIMVPDEAAAKAAYEQAIASWSASTGKELSYLDTTLVRGQASYAGNVSSLKSETCDALFVAEVGDAVLALLGEASNQGVDLPVLVLTSAYSDQFAASAAYSSDIYLPAEWAPYGDMTIDGMQDWADSMDAHGVPKTAFSQGGYLAAQYFIDILESIDGDVTRESFTAAAKGMTDPIDSPIAQAPFLFGDADFHQPNNTAYPVVLRAGTNEWESLGPLLIGDEIGWQYSTVPAGT
ncbi:ABC transporter substrate-binding protein [Demequina zhanjiangensis]|uniref:ABC transporter substrate-binding protein n=1 Tax=Demequina zhanjiangensis TaxID=3051659 RepID=A0ABT8G4R6_9MICO|nr:ABC transporter substrate-binding protein [Demequina sp. SYSU T00b26]MDN4474007.1 ABC transporter substrate-binding protein [Demequina sp. SYSU T00b26]